MVASPVEHRAAGPLLIAPALDPWGPEDPKLSFGRLLAATAASTFQMDASQAVPEQIRARGVDPASVRHVVITHLHYDHASGISQFPGATLVLSKREWEAANGALPVMHGYVGA